MADAPAPPARFLTIEQMSDELAVSRAQGYALIRNGTIPAIKIGGRGQWRVERTKLEEWIERAYRETERFVREHPFTGPGQGDVDAPEPE